MNGDTSSLSSLRPRIALLSPCGWGNLGDAAIIDALMDGIRHRMPEAEIIAFTLNARDTARRHRIRAFPCSGWSPPHYGASEAIGTLDDADGGDEVGLRPRDVAGPTRFPKLRRTWRAAVALPGLRYGYDLAYMVRAEVRLLRGSGRLLRGCRFVVVAGGGQLDEFWGGAFGHPYVLFRWSRLARRHGARFVMLSVGAGALTSRLGRLFVTRALAAADYRSFRDAASRELVRSFTGLAAGDPIVPDLAYSLRVGPGPLRSSRGQPLVVGIAPIAEGDPRVWPVADAGRYERHLHALSALAERALAAGLVVRLFATDGPDHEAARELLARITARTGPRPSLELRPTTSLPLLLETLDEVDVVVAARLHAVLLAHLKGRPTLALSYDRKVASLMEGMGHSRYCMPVEGFDPAWAWDLLGRLAEERLSLVTEIEKGVCERQHQVDAQYDHVFGPRAGEA